ncbi:MAG TPA: biotin--[acetyl-CoA-carboxylase] ligase [Anaerolineales bacterium]|nr:biotin--[acetyl-CoA-carboxylase] ligase [Anaerolineales bacterium]
MNQSELTKALSKLPAELGDIRYFDSIGSTNNEALAWATSGAKDLSLVIADEQRAGRGRLDRKWFTPKGTALAFSLILRPTAQERPYLTRTVGLAALAITDALQARGLVAQIKWPNDVLLNGRKVAGILVESVWSGEEVDYVVIGVGINVLQGAVPSADLIQFPATSLEAALGSDVEREKVLRDILAGIMTLRPRLGTDSFITAWEKALAFRGEQVQIETGSGTLIRGKLLGLESDGSLKLSDEQGKSITVRFGDVRLRPYG